MATVAEKFRGVTGDYNTREVEFIVKQADNEGDAITSTVMYIAQNYPGAAIDGIPLKNVSVEELSYPIGLFKTVASFSTTTEEEKQTNEIELSFDMNLDSRRIYRSISTTSYTAQGKTTRPHHNRINVQNDVAEGVDIRVPVGGFQISWWAPNSAINESYRRTALNMVGKVNNATFYGHQAGEILFAGISGKARSGDDWELVYRFEVSPNETNVTVGDSPDAITVTTVKGWDYLWVEYFDAKDGNLKVGKPREAYVEKVYEEADFSQLGLGT